MSADQTFRRPKPSHDRPMSQRARSPHRRLFGMTLTEILLVIGIIGILVAISVPAFQSVQVRNRKMLEANDIRQLHQAWTMYANFNRDAALPGYVEPQVQQVWRVHYEYPIAPDPAAPQDRLIPQEIAAPWAWRLGTYFDHSLDVLWRYRDAPGRSWPVLAALARDGQLDDLGISNVDQLMETVALEPAFAYNAFHVGGWWEMVEIGRTGSGEIPRPRLFDAKVPGGGGTDVRAQVVSQTIPSIRRPASLVVFCTATRYAEPGIHVRRDDERPGWHVVTPPWWRLTLSTPELRFWSSPAAYLGSTMEREWLIETFNDLEFGNESFSPFGRFNDRPTLIHVDGSIDTTYPAALATPMRWIDRATTDSFEFEPE